MFGFISTIFNTSVCVVFIFSASKIIFHLVVEINILMYDIHDMRRRLDNAEKKMDQLSIQFEEDRKTLNDKIEIIQNLKRILIDQNVDLLNTSNQINEIYECLDLLDDRIVEVAGSYIKKSKRHAKKLIDSYHTNMICNNPQSFH